MNLDEIQRWLLIGITALAILFWAWVIWRFRNNKVLMPPHDRQFLPWQAESVILGFATFLLLPGLVGGLAKEQPAHIRLVFAGGGQLFAMILVSALLLFRHGASPFKTKILDASKNCRYGIVAFVAWIPLVLLVQMTLTRWFKYDQQTINILTNASEGDRTIVAAATFFSAAFVAPVVEEFFFRWLLQGWLHRVFAGSSFSQPTTLVVPEKARAICWPAILITSLLFASVHAGQGPAPVAIFVLSLGIGYLFDRSRSLLACIVVHFLLNAMTMTFLILRPFAEG